MGLEDGGVRGSLNVTTSIPAALTIDTLSATNVTDNTVTLRGEITEIEGLGDDATVRFDWGETGQGLPNTTADQLQGTTGVFTGDISGLTAETEYEFRAEGEVRDVFDEGVIVTVTTSAIPDSAVTRTEDNNSTTGSSKRGIEIAVGSNYGDYTQIEGKISANAAGFTRAQIIRMSDGTIIDTQDVSQLSAGDVFTFDADLTQDTNYAVILDAEGSDYTLGYKDSASFPYTDGGIDIDIVGGIKNATDSANDPSMILGVGGFQ